MSTRTEKQLKQQLLLQKLQKNIKKKRKLEKQSNANNEGDEKSVEVCDRLNEKIKPNGDDLTKAAIEEICRETKRAAERTQAMGASGWSQASVKRTNKRFLNTTMRSVINHNRRTMEKSKIESRKKYNEITGRTPKFGTRTHLFQSTGERLTKKKAE